MVLPKHTEAEPAMASKSGSEFTVSSWDAEAVPPQPPVIVYTIVQLPPATAVTFPEEFTVAIFVLLLLHAPVPPLNTVELVV